MFNLASANKSNQQAMKSFCQQQRQIIDRNIKALILKAGIKTSSKTHNIVGMSIGIYQLGKGACYFNYGHIHLHEKAMPSNKTIYELASITKVFTTTILALYAEEGHLTLTAAIKSDLPAG